MCVIIFAKTFYNPNTILCYQFIHMLLGGLKGRLNQLIGERKAECKRLGIRYGKGPMRSVLTCATSAHNLNLDVFDENDPMEIIIKVMVILASTLDFVEVRSMLC